MVIHRLAWHPYRPFHLSCLTRDYKGIYELVVSPKAYHTDVFDRKDRTPESMKQTAEAIASEYPYRTFSISVFFLKFYSLNGYDSLA